MDHGNAMSKRVCSPTRDTERVNTYTNPNAQEVTNTAINIPRAESALPIVRPVPSPFFQTCECMTVSAGGKYG